MDATAYHNFLQDKNYYDFAKRLSLVANWH